MPDALCPMPDARCPMPYAHEYLIFLIKAIPIPNYPLPILNFEYRKRQDYKKL